MKKLLIVSCETKGVKNMDAKKIKELAGEGISCELGLVDWESTLDFLTEQHDLTLEDREKISQKIHKMVTRIIINL